MTLVDDTREVAEDSGLTPEEKQFSLVTTKADAPEIRVHSEVASVTTKLLEHPGVTVERTREHEGTIVAVTGTISIAYLSVKSVPRTDTNFNTVVSNAVTDGGDDA